MRDKEVSGYKVDLDTPLETFLSVAATIVLVIGLILLKDGYLGGKHSSPSPGLIPYGYGLIALASAIGFCRFLTDCYYVVAEDEKAVYYRFKCLFVEQVDLFKRASELEMVAVKGSKRHSKHSSWYVYFVVLVDSHGEVIPFSDEWRNIDGLHKANELAETIGNSLELPVVKGEAEHQLSVERIKGTIEVNQQSAPLGSGMTPSETNPEVPVWIAVMVIGLALLGLIVLLTRF